MLPTTETKFWNRSSGTADMGTAELQAMQSEVMDWLRAQNHPEAGFAARWMADVKTDEGLRKWLATCGPWTCKIR